jgi:hypothetical protein
MEKIPVSKANRIREEFIAGTLHRTNLAAELGLHRRPVGKHAEKLKQIKTLHHPPRQSLISVPDEINRQAWITKLCL